MGLPTYFLAVHAGSGTAGAQLLDEARAEEKTLTARQLLGSPAYRRAVSACERNARRLLESAASAFGVTVVREEDAAAARASPYEARPDMAVVDHATFYNVLDLAYDAQHGCEVIVYHSHATPLRQCMTGVVATMVEPRHGLVVYYGRRSPGGAWANDCACSFPIGTGRQRDREAAKAARELLLHDASQLEFASRIMSWQGRAQDSAAANARLHRYAPLDAEKARVREHHLGARSASRLKPAYVVVPPPSTITASTL